MAVEVRLPKLSDAMSEATISRWLKEVGDSVDKGEPIVEVETEKVIVEVEAPRAGVIVEIAAPEQSVVAVDALLCRIGAPGERVQPAAREATAPEVEAPPPQPEPPKPPPEPPPEPPREPAAAAAAQAGTSNVVSLRQRPGAVSASPLARRVAEELGIDLTGVQGSGIGGKVVMADLQPYLDTAQAPAPAAPSLGAAPARAPDRADAQPEGHRAAPAARPAPAAERLPEAGYEDVAQTGLRRTIARRMGEAKAGIPHFYMTAEADVTELLALRERLNASLGEPAADDPAAPARVSVNDLMLKATALALERVPALNATYGEDAVRRYAGVHLGFATAIDEGLVTPVVRDCHLKTVGRIARDTRALIDKARRRQLTAEDLQGGTFTISNLGMYEVVEFSAIINPPQVGILAIARPTERPVAASGRVALRHLLRATLSADHRAVDGVTGATFLQAFKDVLEHPERLML